MSANLLTAAAPTALAADLLELVHEGVYLIDRDRRITYWNAGAEKMTGFSAEEVCGACCADNLLNHVTEDGTELCRGHCPVAATLEDGQSRRAQVYLHHKAGHRVAVDVHVCALRDADGQIVGAAEAFHAADTAQELADELAELRRQALVDPLTGLANRRHLEARLASYLSQMERYGWSLGILFADVDRFKEINDTHGHAVGDRILTMVAATLRHATRASDLVARLAGDEFMALAQNIDAERLAVMSGRLQHLVSQSFVIHEGQRVQTTLSIGALLAEPGDTVEGVITKADALMYESKRGGRNRATVAGPHCRMP